MNSLSNLITTLGVEKTLVIACGDLGVNNLIEYNDHVFVYFLPDNTLRRHDPKEKGSIQHFVESRGCTQIVFVGTIDESLISRIKYNESFQPLRAAFKFNLKSLLKNNGKEMLTPTLFDQLLVELHVVTQCKHLMEYYFIKERVDKNQIKVKGMIYEAHEEYMKSIFYNGITFDDLVSMN